MAPLPEDEVEDSYTAPVVSGRWIWTANPLSGRVALIDAEELTVMTAEAGLAPTYLTALGSGSDTESAAVVLNVVSRDASVLRAKDGVIEVVTVPVHNGANRLTVSQSGRWVLVWSDATLVPNVDPTEGMQDVTVLDLAGSEITTQRLTVGYRPSRVVIEDDERAAYVVAEPGVSVVALSDDEAPRVVRDVPVTLDPSEAASARDVTVTADGEFAFVRREGRREVEIVSLDDGRTRKVTLPAAVTDLDLSPDGKLAFAVARFEPASAGGGSGGTGGNAGSGASAGTNETGGNGGTSGTPGAAGAGAGADDGVAGLTSSGGETGSAGSGSDAGGQAGAAEGGAGAIDAAGAAGAPASGGAQGGEASGVAGEGAGGAEPSGVAGAESGPVPETSFVAVLPVPRIFEDPEAFALVPIDEVVGSVSVAPAGDVAVLFTTVGESDRLTILDTSELGTSTGVANVEPRTVVVKAPVRAVLPTPDGEHAVVLLKQAPGSQKPGGFSLVPLKASLPPKIVGTDVPPLSVGIGEHEALITIDGKNAQNAPVHGVYLARLPELSTKLVTLASPPLAAALVPEAHVGFVAQAHAEGRITFLDLDSGAPRTITGFELSAQVVE
jgi:hypothetical protein